jgi:hypothetical protein
VVHGSRMDRWKRDVADRLCHTLYMVGRGGHEGLRGAGYVQRRVPG